MTSDERTYWYECQERAMAPGIADGWPEVIPAPHTPNGRLVRRDGQPAETIERLTRERDEARSLVRRWCDGSMTIDNVNELEAESRKVLEESDGEPPRDTADAWVEHWSKALEIYLKKQK